MSISAKLWNELSYLGVGHNLSSSDKIRIVLSNKITFIVIIIFVIGTTHNLVTSLINGAGVPSRVYPQYGIIGACLAALYFNSAHRYTLAKLTLIYAPIVIRVLLPPLFQETKSEYFIWSPLTIIGLSILPHLVFSIKDDKWIYIITVAVQFLLLLVIDYILLYGYTGSPEWLKLYFDNLYNIKSIHVLLYLFINFTIIYILKTNNKYKKTLLETKQQLHLHSQIIQEQKEELQSHEEVLLRQNQELEQKDNDLTAYQGKVIELNNSLEERVKLRTLELSNTNRKLAEYAFINSHLLRGPLCRIKGLLYLITLEGNLSNEELAQKLNDALEEMEIVVRKINFVLSEGSELTREHLFKVYSHEEIRKAQIIDQKKL